MRAPFTFRLDYGKKIVCFFHLWQHNVFVKLIISPFKMLKGNPGYGPPKEKDACVKGFSDVLNATLGNSGTYLCAFQEGFGPGSSSYETCCPGTLISYAWDIAQAHPACKKIQFESGSSWKLSKLCQGAPSGPDVVLTNGTSSLCYLNNKLQEC